MRWVRGFGRFWYDLVIGDDWRIAVAVVTVLLVGGLLVVAGLGGSALLAPLLAVAVAVAFSLVLLLGPREPG